jgi:hypothetical protein
MIDFEVYGCEKHDTWGMEITSGDFAGVVLEISEMTFNAEEEGLLTFDYHVIKTPAGVTAAQVSKSKEFEQVLQYTIQKVITDAVEWAQKNPLQEQTENVMISMIEQEEAENDRTNNSNKSGSQ